MASRAMVLCAAGCLAAACGGSTVDMLQLDGSTDAGGDDAAPDATSATPDAGVDAPGDTTQPIDSPSADAAPSCAPPADSTKAALCISFTHDALTFVASDPSFDGKGLLAVDVHDTPNPDGPDGGSLQALSGMIFPSGAGGDGGDAGEIDLSSALPAVRFDGLPAGVVYPRGIFVDSRDTQKVGAGWWLGGYDLSSGLKTPALLRPVTLSAGTATSITIDLTALRALGVTLTRSVDPAGNGQGPATVVVTAESVPTDASTLFGAASVPCANLAAADASVTAHGFVLGAGPYYALGVLDDFAPEGGSILPPGAITSLSLVDGAATNPPSARLQYPAAAYVVQQAVDLDLVIPLPDGGTEAGDPVSCP